MGLNAATLGIFLPELLGLTIAFILLSSRAPRGRMRNYGLAGVAIMAVCALLGLALSLFQNAMAMRQAASGGGNLADLYPIMLAARMLLRVVTLGGLLLIVWGLCEASRRAARASSDQDSNAAPP
ncbi:MAG: hypothetical protein E6Q88_03505 [Lysobacteraceae bacterium]|nr:MAG: hypothetical protein E6Q88_03505 [Xanthomonadaceae bacterium]